MGSTSSKWHISRCVNSVSSCDGVLTVWTTEQRHRQSELMVARWADPISGVKQALSIKKPPQCNVCGKGDITNFHVDSKSRRTSSVCKECHKVQCRSRYNAMSSLERWAEKATRYGLTKEVALELVATQKGLCAICGNLPEGVRGLHVDHCHNTGVVRGLLCHGCNTGIGNLKDDPELLERAVKYLRSIHE